MKTVDWRERPIDDGILTEPTADGNRLILWVRGDRDQAFQYWERITSVPHAEITVAGELCSTTAAAVPTRQSIGGGMGALFRRITVSAGNRELSLPTGETVSPCGPRRSDLILVWAGDNSHSLDESAIKTKWPQATKIRRLGPGLYLADGVTSKSETASAQPASAPTASGQPQAPSSPRVLAERNLAEARRSGDKKAEVVALTDLGVINTNEGKAKAAVPLLEQALTIARQLGDPARESDALQSLGMALLSATDPRHAREIFERELNRSRQNGDQLAEKLNLERLGLALARYGDHAGAGALFDQALVLARKFGDRQQEANLLWYQSIHLAELGNRDLAITRAEESIAVFKAMGKPQAAWYGAQLQKFRMGLTAEVPLNLNAGVSTLDYLGGATVAQMMGGQQTTAGAGASGPGLLRMALSATKAMASFVGSGFKIASPELQKKRLETCKQCEHHSGLRCRVCGCFTTAKSSLVHEDCPIGKWPK
jgi:tetratricopeptide (TPR) repeat protein